MLKRRRGAFIDSHDAIFRMNLAPTWGFESFVGRRTTFRVVNGVHCAWQSAFPYLHHSICFPPHASTALAWIELKRVALLQENHSASWSRARRGETTLRSVEEANLLTYAPRAFQSAHPEWRVPAPTLGYVGVMVAMQLCEWVRWVGFDGTEPTAGNFHFWDIDGRSGRGDVARGDSFHNFSFEGAMLRSMQAGSLRYRRTLTRADCVKGDGGWDYATCGSSWCDGDGGRGCYPSLRDRSPLRTPKGVAVRVTKAFEDLFGARVPASAEHRRGPRRAGPSGG